MNNLIVAGRAVGLASHFFIWLLGACLLAIVTGRRAGGEDSPMAMAGREVGLVTFILCGLLCILHMVLLTLGLVAEPRKYKDPAPAVACWRDFPMCSVFAVLCLIMHIGSQMEGENGQLLVDVGISGIGALLVFIISPTLALRLYNY